MRPTRRFDHTPLWTNCDTRALDWYVPISLTKRILSTTILKVLEIKTVSAIPIESVLSFAVAIAVNGIRVLGVVCSLASDFCNLMEVPNASIAGR